MLDEDEERKSLEQITEGHQIKQQKAQDEVCYCE
jgi:hypothetical protein